MVCLLCDLILGWLVTINFKNVKEEAKESVKKNRIECCQVLFEYNKSKSDFFQAKRKYIDEIIVAYDRLREDFKFAEKNLKQAKIDLYKAKDFTYEDWVESKRQTKIEFPAEN